MKDSFRGYYRPSEGEFASLWKDALFVPDASTLLNLYACSSAVRGAILATLRHVADSLWLPHQFCLEYHRNRPRVIVQEISHYRAVAGDITRILNQHLRPPTRHPHINQAALDVVLLLEEELARGLKECEALLSTDPLLADLTALFDGRVGAAPSELVALHEKARARYEQKTPPGYEDAKKKPVPDAYGDFIAWRQILDKCSNPSRPCVLVTDDRKDDWWWRADTHTLGPRPELVAEFHKECNAGFYMYSTDRFVKYAATQFNTPLAPEVIEEMQQRPPRSDEDAKPQSDGRPAPAPPEAPKLGPETAAKPTSK